MFLPYYIDTDRGWEYRQRIPWVVALLLCAYVTVHVHITEGMIPDARMDLFYRYGVVQHRLQWYSFFTCTFLHGGWLHLIGNAYFLLLYGFAMERLLGSARFLGLYAAGALFSMLVHVWTLPPFMIDVPTVGASGAISAVLGGFFVLMPKAKVHCMMLFFFRPIFIGIPAFLVLGVWFLWQLLSSIDPALAGSGIAFWAHAAGFAAGTGMATLMYRLVRRRSQCMEKSSMQPLAEAWNAFLQGRRHEAAGLLEGYAESMKDAYRGNLPLIRGLIELHQDRNPREGVAQLFRASHHAVARLDHAGTVTAYLQIRRYMADRMIPAEMHCHGANAALSCRRPVLGLRAIAGAFEAGLDHGAERLLERAEAVLRNTLDQPDAADRVGRLMKAGAIR